MLTSQLYLDILGHSVHQPRFVAISNELKLGSAPEPDSFGISRIADKTNGIYFEFTPKKWYEKEYGFAKSTFVDSPEELILVEITFENNFSKNKKPFNIPLPYNLQSGDTAEIIIQKLGKKPYEKSKDHHYDEIQFNYYFYKDEFKVLIKLDDKLKLLWLRIWLIDLSTKYKIDLKKSLAKQNKNLTAKNIPLLIEQKEKSPVKLWEKRMNEGDDLFTHKNIALTKKALEQFIDQLSDASNEKKATKIYSAIKKIVFALNKDSHFIETLEREELVDFIHSSVRLTGFLIDDNVDLTEQWREW